MIAPGTSSTCHTMRGVVKTVDDSTACRASRCEDRGGWWGMREGGRGGEREEGEGALGRIEQT